MQRNKIKQAPKDDGAVIGIGASFPLDLPTLRVLANGGADWLFLDMEHGSGGIGQLQDVAQILNLLGFAGVVRVPNLAYEWAARSLLQAQVQTVRREFHRQLALPSRWPGQSPGHVGGFTARPPAE